MRTKIKRNELIDHILRIYHVLDNPNIQFYREPYIRFTPTQLAMFNKQQLLKLLLEIHPTIVL